MGFFHHVGTWLARFLIAYQIVTSYWTIEEIDATEFQDPVKSQFQFILRVWCWLSILFGLACFIAIKNFTDPVLNTEACLNTIYYDFLDLGTRFAYMLCWIYYFVVAITWIHHADLNIPNYAVLLGFIILTLLAYVKEVNIKFLLILFGLAHCYISILVGNISGIVLALIMIVNSQFVLGCTDPAPIAYNPTLIFTTLTILSTLAFNGFISYMRENVALVVKDLTIFSIFNNLFESDDE